MTTRGTKYRGTKEYILVYAELVNAAGYRGLVTYEDIAQIMGIDCKGNYMAREVGQLLGEISQAEHEAGRPMLSALVVGVSGQPGSGFYRLARDLGKLENDSSEGRGRFLLREREAVYANWARARQR